ncbi:hypothetical protein [Epinotia aporema granulovirus]|uniref:Uncharacterized protein n=1 Tax=Epinotia aporema granulovirus TaxID=166056 RepID=K4EQE7_9BBAC|nr:hypothetical protein [Epinotia aporema granulovirus]AER41498.1 hypothetical protein [Epinotia aporema granulovirus]
MLRCRMISCDICHRPPVRCYICGTEITRRCRRDLINHWDMHTHTHKPKARCRPVVCFDCVR